MVLVIQYQLMPTLEVEYYFVAMLALEVEYYFVALLRVCVVCCVCVCVLCEAVGLFKDIFDSMFGFQFFTQIQYD